MINNSVNREYSIRVENISILTTEAFSMIFPIILGGRRSLLKSNYSVNLPKGLLTSVLKEFCKSRRSILSNHEMASQAGCQIRQDDLDKCLGVMDVLVNQRINQSKAQKIMIDERVKLIRSELSRPMNFEDFKDEKSSLIDEIVNLKDKIVPLIGRRSS